MQELSILTSKTSSKPSERSGNTKKSSPTVKFVSTNQNAEWSVWPPRVLPTPSVLAGEAPPPGRYIAVQAPPARVFHRLCCFRREKAEGDCDIWANRRWEDPARYRARQAAQWRNHQRRFCPGLERVFFFFSKILLFPCLAVCLRRKWGRKERKYRKLII
jgi:hypothetical protein